MAVYSETIVQRRRLRVLAGLLFAVAALFLARLVYLQIVRHEYYLAKASTEHTRKYEIPPSRGLIYVRDGDEGRVPVAMNQQFNILYADPRYVSDKADAARRLAAVTGGDAAVYQTRIEKGIEYAVLARRVPNDTAAKIRALHLRGIGLSQQEYRVYPEGELAAQLLGFVNADDKGQYGIEQYLDTELAGKPGQLAAKTDTNGIPIATIDNVIKAPEDGPSYLLTIDRNIQAYVEKVLAEQIKSSKAKSGSVVVMDPSNGAIRAMASYPTYDPNNYSKVTDYSVFMNQAVTAVFEPGSGVKAFTLAAGLDKGVITPDSKYDDPGCVKVSDRTICNAAGDKTGKGKTMTVVLRDSLNTGVMYVLRLLGGDVARITLPGKKILYDYFVQHFGFGQRTGIEQAGEAAGVINLPDHPGGSDVNFANMTFGQGMSVTMVQMVAAMGAIANGGRMYQPRLIDGQIQADGTVRPEMPKVLRENVISKKAADDITKMLTVVVEHGSGYNAHIPEYKDRIAGKTGTAQIPKLDGTGYIENANIGSFTGFAPAEAPKFVLMVRINEPQIEGYAEKTTVPAFRSICDWLFKYYGIAPNGS